MGGPLRVVLGWLLLLALLPGAALAAEPKPNAETRKSPPAKAAAKGESAKTAEPDEWWEEEEAVPVHIWADKIRYIREKNLALATGNVTAIKGGFRVDCDTLRGTLDPETKKFKKLLAEGDVHIYNVLPIPDDAVDRPPRPPLPAQLAPKGKRGTCQTADYDLETGIVILTGPREQQPFLTMNKDQIQADRIVYDQRSDEATFDGRVRLAALVPKQEKASSPGEKKPGEPGKAKSPADKEAPKPTAK